MDLSIAPVGPPAASGPSGPVGPSGQPQPGPSGSGPPRPPQQAPPPSLAPLTIVTDANKVKHGGGYRSPTQSIFSIKDQCEKVCFMQTHNHGLGWWLLTLFGKLCTLRDAADLTMSLFLFRSQINARGEVKGP